jgi:CheY-like chemotaxis protein
VSAEAAKTVLWQAFQKAAWPVLLLDSAAMVQQANGAAVSRFGPALEGKVSLETSIWSSENCQRPLAFLQQPWDPAQLPVVHLRTRSGETRSYFASMCSFFADEERFYLLQLFFSPAGPPGEAIPPPSDLCPAPEAVESPAQKQKLDCALQLARVVALDFNNALASILGHASLLLSQAPPDHPWRRSLMEVEKSAAKAAEISNDLAEWSSQDQGPPSNEGGNLNDLLHRMVTAFKADPGCIVQWSLSFEEGLYAVKLDEAKIQQAVAKVLENAVEATGLDGRVEVRTRNLSLPEPWLDGTTQLRAGSHVCVEIADNGEGIRAEVLPRVFEPFFTTKGGKHRGLGLTWVYGIVTNHGGSVAISSRPNSGTSVRLYLPAQEKLVNAPVLRSDDLTGHETILLVDDESLVLTMGETILASYGYKVFTASSGARALELFSPAPERIDLVITDMVMPQMNGRELIDRLRAIAPTVRVLCASGYHRNPVPETGVGYLKKPFTSRDFLRKVKQCLAQL